MTLLLSTHLRVKKNVTNSIKFFCADPPHNYFSIFYILKLITQKGCKKSKPFIRYSSESRPHLGTYHKCGQKNVSFLIVLCVMICVILSSFAL